MSSKDGRIRKNIILGATVQIVLKENQRNGHLTKGEVAELLTSSAKHPYGIKVRLKSGQVGRVKKVLSMKKGAVENADPVPLEPPKKRLPWERW